VVHFLVVLEIDAMWGKNDKDKDNDQNREVVAEMSESKKTASYLDSKEEQAYIGATVVIRGEISAEENLLVQGTVEGSINIKNNTLKVGREGTVNATIDAKTVHVEGRVDGDMESSELVMIHDTGRMTGNIKANRIVLKDGCRFRGHIEMDMEEKRGGAVAKAKGGAGQPEVKP
jgi:cytoskeletal protein CcmA (bactofilin family)